MREGVNRCSVQAGKNILWRLRIWWQRDPHVSGERHELCRGLHAEQNAIIQAAYHGTSIAGADLYCTNRPCIICSKMIINAGIEKVYYQDGYSDPLAEEMVSESGLVLIKIEPKNK